MKRYIIINGVKHTMRSKRDIKQFWKEYATWA